MICKTCGKQSDETICSLCYSWGLTEAYSKVKNHKREGRLAAGIVFTDGKKILLLKRNEKSGVWSIPGGRADKNETPLETAKRESKEECGSSEGEVFDHFFRKYENQHFHTFMVSIKSPFKVKISDEHSDFAWVPIKDVEEMKLHPKFRECWKVILASIKKRYPNRVSFIEWVSEKQ